MAQKPSARKRKAHNQQPARSLKKVTQTQRQRAALELRTAGHDFDTIAAKLGYRNRSGAYKAVEEALRKTLQEPADAVRQQELLRLDRLLQGLWEMATTPGMGQLEAVDRALKIMDRRTHYLLGLDVGKQDVVVPSQDIQAAAEARRAAVQAVRDRLEQIAARYAQAEKELPGAVTPGASGASPA